MNNQSLSWIDRGRWAGLLAKATEVLAPTPRAAAAWPPLRPPASGVGAAGPRPRARRPTPPLPGVPIPPAAPRLPGVPAPPVARTLTNLSPPPAAPLSPARPAAGYPPFTSPSRSLEERLQALVSWIEDCVPCHAAFIADDNGLPVVEHLGASPADRRGVVDLADARLGAIAHARQRRVVVAQARRDDPPRRGGRDAVGPVRDRRRDR